MSEKTSFVLYTDYMGAIEGLDMAQRGILLTAAMKYTMNEELPEMDAVTSMAFAFIKQQLDRDTEKWEGIKTKRAEAGSKGGKQKVANQANATFDKQKVANQAVNVNVNVNDNVNVNVNPLLYPNNIQEVEEYCRKENLKRVNPSQFYSYYSNNGWKDKDGEPIRDWQLVIKAWEIRAKEKPSRPAYKDFKQRDYNFEELEKVIIGNG